VRHVYFSIQNLFGPNLYVDQLNPEGRANAVIREDHTWTEVSYDVAREYMLIL